MTITGKHKRYEGDTLKGVAFDPFNDLMATQKPFCLMVQPARDEAIKEDWDIIQSQIKPALKGKPKIEAPE